MTDLLAPLATGAVLSLALVPLCRRLAARYGCVAHPAADRWHRQSVPLFGGVAIAGATLLGLLLLDGIPRPPVLAGGAAAFFALGAIDDIRPLNASTRLVVQFVVASAFVFLGHTLPWTGSQTGDAVLTVLWVVGVTNAFNLLDNMDGLCGGVALIAGLALLAILLPAAGEPAGLAETRYLACLTGAVAGFLRLQPAAGIHLHGRRREPVHRGELRDPDPGRGRAGDRTDGAVGSGGGSPPCWLLLVPIVDTVLVTCTRLLAARSTLAGGRDHASHRLVALGLSERRAVALALGVRGGGGRRRLERDQAGRKLVGAADVRESPRRPRVRRLLGGDRPGSTREGTRRRTHRRPRRSRRPTRSTTCAPSPSRCSTSA